MPLPAVIRRVSFFYRHKYPVAGCCDFVVCLEHCVNRDAVAVYIADVRLDDENAFDWGRTPENHVELAGNSTWWDRRAVLEHQSMRGCPVAVAIEQSAEYPAVDNSVEREVVWLRTKFCDHFVPLNIALDSEPFVVVGAAPEAAILGGIAVLEAVT